MAGTKTVSRACPQSQVSQVIVSISAQCTCVCSDRVGFVTYVSQTISFINPMTRTKADFKVTYVLGVAC